MTRRDGVRQYVLKIDLTGEAFEDRPGAEVARLLRQYADGIDGGDWWLFNARMRWAVVSCDRRGDRAAEAYTVRAE